ncbi:MAG: MFS transporter [Bacteroidota bacterium]
MTLTPAISRRNFFSLLWHAGFLAFAQNFMDVDTIIPAMMVDAGGTAVHIGILTAIMLGGSSVTQLFFAPFISNFSYKKRFLLMGINSRIIALLLMGILLYYSVQLRGDHKILMIFLLITIFSLGGAFANVSYTDIMGKSLDEGSRKPFFSIRQVVIGLILFGSAFLARYLLGSADYPMNYSYMFFVGFIALSIASLGFWNLKEVVPSKLVVRGPKHFLQIIGVELKQNRRLLYFLGFINTMGISITLLPFIILYAKSNFGLESTGTGNYLLFKVMGGVLTGLLLFAFSGKYKYRLLLYLVGVLALTIPLIVIIFPGISSFHLVFFLGGIIFAAYSISMNGVLLEVSGTSNRTLYTGIAGAGNILPALFPLGAGWMIKQFGFLPYFILFMVVIISSFYFIYRLRCEK